ncbi:guanylate-binding protein 1-like [Hypanus sabinus]|uniref:guanylate-binding protein 1-like n=1 Tax=Hypanus sabinus TaxID=79690 RepID=UPI0028C4CA5A|nr:guanylate-binding protein 1-like [Hypanus sabinus]
MSVTGAAAATNQKMEKPLQLVYNKDEKMQLNPEALKVLQSIKDPMVVVAVVGAARTGKSYLMNCLAGDKKGFSVVSTMQAHTKGIWMWCRSLPQRPNEVLLLLDTEGLGDPEKGDNQNDNSIYLLTILLSSILIYNGQRKIDQQSLQDLHFVTELSKRIQMKSQPDVHDSWDFVRFFPEFVWVIRDLTLDMNVDGKDVTPNEYLEHILKLKDCEISEQDKKYNELRRCIRDHFPSRCCFALPIPTSRKKLKKLQELEDKDLDEDFVTERQNLINYIHTHKKVKRVVGGQLVTGRRFVELTKAYMDMMADGGVPCVESCVAIFAELENQAAVDEALKFYEDEMNKFSEADDLTMSQLLDLYNEKSMEAFDIFQKRIMNSNSDKFSKQLKEKMKTFYITLRDKIKEKSEKRCEKHLREETSSIKANMASGHYWRFGGYQELKDDLDKAIKEYEKKTKNEMEGDAVLVRFLEERNRWQDQIHYMDGKLMQQRMHVSELEKELSRLKQEMVKKEQQRMVAEEHRNQEIMRKIRKKCEECTKCSVEELKEAMEHMRSEKVKYEDEGRMEDAERAHQRYEYLKKKYEEANESGFIKFFKKFLGFSSRS